MKKFLPAVAVAAGIGLAAPASAVVISNIDFGVTGGFHIETMTLAQQFINPATTPAGTGSGAGYGVITSLNGNLDYCAVGNCALYYTVNFAGGTFAPGGGSITFTGTDVTLFYDPNPARNFFGFTSPANLTFIQGLTPYATLVGHGDLGGGLPANVVSSATGSLSGTTLNLTGFGLLDVDRAGPGNAAFARFIDGNGIQDAAGGLADIAYTESANNLVLNPRDLANGLAVGCRTGAAATGQWCWQGTLNTRGVVPEPSTLALLALGLLGGGLVVRRRREDRV